MPVRDHKQLWEECKRFISDVVPKEQFEAWFGSVESVSFDGEKLHLLVPSAFFQDQIEERYIDVLGAGLRKVYGHGVMLYYVYQQVQHDPVSLMNVRSGKPSPTILAQTKVDTANPYKAPDHRPFDPQLNPQYNFENYCTSHCNEVACKIGESIAANPSVNTFNPLFVFGGTGVGKTHLIQAIGVRIKERNPDSRVLYLTARLFESQFTASSLLGDANNFFHFYQSIDTLIMDDVQDLISGNKKATQNIFFHIFNHLQQQGKQIILSSDTAPSELDGFETRLLSRFRSGMSVELEKPDLELRRKVLLQKAEQEGVQLPKDVMDYICENITDSVRDLLGAMLSLTGNAAIKNCDINMDLAKMVVGNIVKAARKNIGFDTIVKGVCDFYSVDPTLLVGNSRKREISDARQVVIYLSKTIGRLPVTVIANKINREHSTVIYACNKVEERMSIEKKFCSEVSAIRQKL